MNKFEILEATLNSLIKQPCWSIMVRDGFENGLTLSMGEKVERNSPLDAPNLTDEQKQYRGEFELAIADCTWRLDSPDVIVTSWSDNATIKHEALTYILGQYITEWEITWPGLDLTLHFNNDLSLRAFCDQTDPDDGGENYALLAPEYVFTIGVRSHLTVTPHPKA